MTGFGVVIPARYGSTRLPGKPLRALAGKPLVIWVLEAAKRAGADFVVVAVDDERIARVVEAYGGEAVMTSVEHQSGTDRVAEVVRTKQLDGDAIVVNVQGDEPLLEPYVIGLVARALLERPAVGMATLATPISTVDDLFSPHVVKVVLDHDGHARTFGRAPLPWVRDAFGALPDRPESLPGGIPFLRHVGLYGYRVRTLLAVAEATPPAWERAEALEQLRALWLGFSIHVTIVAEAPHHGVDTAEDLAKMERVLAGREGLGAPRKTLG